MQYPNRQINNISKTTMNINRSESMNMRALWQPNDMGVRQPARPWSLLQVFAINKKLPDKIAPLFAR